LGVCLLVCFEGECFGLVWDFLSLQS